MKRLMIVLALLFAPQATAQSPAPTAERLRTGLSDADWSTLTGGQLLSKALALVSMDALTAAANDGDERAQTLVATALIDGNAGLARDCATAVGLARQADAKAFSRAAIIISRGYEGCGLPRDDAQRRAYAEKATNAGLAIGAYTMAQWSLDGVGEPVDLPRGRQLLWKAHEGGMTRATARLAKYISEGRYGYQRDDALARQLAQSVADSEAGANMVLYWTTVRAQQPRLPFDKRCRDALPFLYRAATLGDSTARSLTAGVSLNAAQQGRACPI